MEALDSLLHGLAAAATPTNLLYAFVGVLLFFGAARLLGSRRLVRDVLVSVAVPVVAFLLFTQVLGVYLPAGPE